MPKADSKGRAFLYVKSYTTMEGSLILIAIVIRWGRGPRGHNKLALKKGKFHNSGMIKILYQSNNLTQNNFVRSDNYKIILII